MRRALAVLTALCALSCTASGASKDTLRKAGYTNIKITGWNALSCSDSDIFSTGFTATNPRGQRVSGVVCCGILKSCTIRF